MSARERRILIPPGLLLICGIGFLAGRLAFPELWPWF
jgi:hypothetical protein